MNTWRNHIMERVELFAPTKATIEGQISGDGELPAMSYQSGLRMMPFDLSGYPQLVSLLQNRCLVMFFHPDTLNALSFVEMLVDSMFAAAHMEQGHLSAIYGDLPSPPTSPLPLVVAHNIDLGALTDALRIEPLAGIPWVQVVTAAAMVSGVMHPVPPVLLIDASHPELPPFVQWVLHGTHENVELDDVLDNPAVPAAVRERLVQYIASRANPFSTTNPRFRPVHLSSSGSSGSSQRN